MIERGGEVELIAGPCSITNENTNQILSMAQITVKNLKGKSQLALWGTRVVGLKSRTGFNSEGIGMGIDFGAVMQNIMILSQGNRNQELIVPPSVEVAKTIAQQTGLAICTEIVAPYAQVSVLEREMKNRKMLLWNPAVEQLGWSLIPIAVAAQRNNWDVGIKNGKWLGCHLADAHNPESNEQTDLEKTWTGLASYVQNTGVPLENIAFIHRGVTVPDRENFRNAPVHEVARRTKRTTRGAKLYFDPSHSFGPNMRDHILQGTINALLMTDGNDWLYNGALIEAGDSPTDTNQHITLGELESLAREISRYRNLVTPKQSTNVFCYNAQT
ncbi:hypothetical protein HGA88_05105 [Candidatus Roizmanbacteria bacterium]|nr:hypothetical protein [Candidatus Roizmanbacteria bacterium]